MPLLYPESYSKLETIIGQRVIWEDQAPHLCLEEAVWGFFVVCLFYYLLFQNSLLILMFVFE